MPKHLITVLGILHLNFSVYSRFSGESIYKTKHLITFVDSIKVAEEGPSKISSLLQQLNFRATPTSSVRGAKAQNRTQPWEASVYLTERTSKMSAHSQTWRDFSLKSSCLISACYSGITGTLLTRRKVTWKALLCTHHWYGPAPGSFSQQGRSPSSLWQGPLQCGRTVWCNSASSRPSDLALK